MSDRGNLKVVPLSEEARFNPLKCVAELLIDLDEGRLKADRVVIVVLKEGGGIHTRASGPGMDSMASAIGILHLGIAHLVEFVMGRPPT